MAGAVAVPLYCGDTFPAQQQQHGHARLPTACSIPRSNGAARISLWAVSAPRARSRFPVNPTAAFLRRPAHVTPRGALQDAPVVQDDQKAVPKSKTKNKKDLDTVGQKSKQVKDKTAELVEDEAVTESEVEGSEDNTTELVEEVEGRQEEVVDEKLNVKQKDDQREDEQEEQSKNELEEEDIEFEKGYSMTRVCDRLIEVFMIEKPDPEEWRKLLAFSQEWRRIRPYFYKMCNSRAESEEDPRKMGNLYKLARRLKEVDDEMIRHDALLEEIEKDETQLDALVAKRRKDFTSDFFKHLRLLCDANHGNPNRREKIAELGTRCLASVEEYDKIAGDNVALDAARQKFEDILNSPSLQAACTKIDQLVKAKQFDPALMLLISKAWASAKESPMMKEEVKDIMFHLYNVAKGNMQRLVPKEVRILKHLLTVEDPRERLGALSQAFSPGDELEGKDVDLLYTTPLKLYQQINFVLDAYHSNKQQTLIKEAQKLMDPAVITRLEVLKDVIKDEFL